MHLGHKHPFSMALKAEAIMLVQGVFPPGTFKQLGLPGNWYGSLEWQYPPHQRQGAYEEEGRAVNTLKVTTPCLCSTARMSGTFELCHIGPCRFWGSRTVVQGAAGREGCWRWHA